MEYVYDLPAVAKTATDSLHLKADVAVVADR